MEVLFANAESYGLPGLLWVPSNCSRFQFRNNGSTGLLTVNLCHRGIELLERGMTLRKGQSHLEAALPGTIEDAAAGRSHGAALGCLRVPDRREEFSQDPRLPRPVDAQSGVASDPRRKSGELDGA